MIVFECGVLLRMYVWECVCDYLFVSACVYECA